MLPELPMFPDCDRHHYSLHTVLCLHPPVPLFIHSCCYSKASQLSPDHGLTERQQLHRPCLLTPFCSGSQERTGDALVQIWKGKQQLLDRLLQCLDFKGNSIFCYFMVMLSADFRAIGKAVTHLRNSDEAERHPLCLIPPKKLVVFCLHL